MRFSEISKDEREIRGLKPKPQALRGSIVLEIDPPDHISGWAKHYWKKYAELLKKEGRYTEDILPLLEWVCEMMASGREKIAGGEITPSHINTAMRGLEQLGLTPIGRIKMNLTGKPQEGDTLDMFEEQFKGSG